MSLVFNGKEFRIDRYPASTDRSLRAFSAADEHLLRFMEDDGEAGRPIPGPPLILHDRFGALTVPLHPLEPVCPVFLKSQERSIRANLEANGLEAAAAALPPALAPFPPAPLALMRIPKSLDLFRFTLSRLAAVMPADGTAVAGFMTRHFSPRIPGIAGDYFSEVTQSQAWKKSRLLLLRNPKTPSAADPDLPEEMESLPPDDGRVLRQYPGVFSAGGVDAATAFLLEHLTPDPDVRRILDLGCGNGIIALALRRMVPEAEIHLLDDSLLAVESARFNTAGRGMVCHWSDGPAGLESGSFDLVVTNPPFHFEHEIDISVPIRLFRESREVLRPGGVLEIVANRHLNYRTHLTRLFTDVQEKASNRRFEILRARK